MRAASIQLVGAERSELGVCVRMNVITIVEDRHAFARLTSRSLVNPIEPQAMSVNVQFRRRTKTLNERYRAGDRCVAVWSDETERGQGLVIAGIAGQADEFAIRTPSIRIKPRH